MSIGIITDPADNPRKTGVGYYVENALLPLGREADIFLIHRSLSDDPRYKECRQLVYPTCGRWPNPFLLKKFLGENKITLILLPSFSLFLLPFFFWKPKETRLGLVLHDFYFLISANPWREVSFLYILYHFFSKLAFGIVRSRPDFFIAVSENTKRDAITLAGIPEGKITVIHEAADDIFRKFPGGSEGSYLLTHWAGMEVLQIFKDLACIFPELRLKVVGRLDSVGSLLKEKRSKFLAENNLQSRVDFLDYVDMPTLVKLYNEAALYLRYAQYEGFGLPVLEAMACGCPVLASDRGSLPEVGGTAALYADPKDLHAWVELASRILKDSDFRSRKIEEGRENVKRFSWEKTRKETRDLLLQINEGTSSK